MASKKRSKGSRKPKTKFKKSLQSKHSVVRAITRLRTINDKPGWMGIEGLHLAFTTKSTHALASFYRDILGFVDASHRRRASRLKPGYSRSDDAIGMLEIQSTRDTSIAFQDYNLAYHQVTQTGGRPPEEPLTPQLFLIVRNVDRVYERLSKKGMQFFGPPRDMPSGYRVAECLDPEGRRLTFAQVLKTRK